MYTDTSTFQNYKILWMQGSSVCTCVAFQDGDRFYTRRSELQDVDLTRVVADKCIFTFAVETDGKICLRKQKK